ncbi:hypothetical protein [Crossiella sp. NPDC003009]
MSLALRGGFRYELRMTARSRLLWVALGGVTLVLAVTALASVRMSYGLAGPRVVLGEWALTLNLLTPLVIAFALADRLVRAREAAGQADLFATTPAGPGIRLLGTLGGALSVALAPVTALLLVVGLVLAVRHADPAAVGWAVLACLTVVYPATVLLTAFAATLALVLRAPVARLATVAVWLWAIAWNPRLFPGPSITGTVLSPAGDYVVGGLFGARVMWAGQGQPAGLAPPVTGQSALLNLALLLAMAGTLLVLARFLVAGRR